jgi:hypothetical protein
MRRANWEAINPPPPRALPHAVETLIAQPITWRPAAKRPVVRLVTCDGERVGTGPVSDYPVSLFRRRGALTYLDQLHRAWPAQEA